MQTYHFPWAGWEHEVFVIGDALSSTLALNDGEVHFHHARLACTDAQLNVYQACISPAEFQQSKKFIREKDQRQQVMCSALTRKVLSHYLKINPLEIDFQHGEHGKPAIKNQTLQFNISHSGDYFLLGVSQQVIGVDIEKMRDHRDYLALAKRFFTTHEYQAIQNQYDFYRCWTRKEAFIKATGQGLSFGLSNFEVDVPPRENNQSALISVHNEPALAQSWFLQSVSLYESEDIFAAFCVKNVDQKLAVKLFDISVR